MVSLRLNCCSTRIFSTIDKNFLMSFFIAHNGDVHGHRRAMRGKVDKFINWKDVPFTSIPSDVII